MKIRAYGSQTGFVIINSYGVREYYHVLNYTVYVFPLMNLSHNVAKNPKNSKFYSEILGRKTHKT